jgi:hypothetical protein
VCVEAQECARPALDDSMLCSNTAGLTQQIDDVAVTSGE